MTEAQLIRDGWTVWDNPLFDVGRAVPLDIAREALYELAANKVTSVNLQWYRHMKATTGWATL